MSGNYPIEGWKTPIFRQFVGMRFGIVKIGEVDFTGSHNLGKAMFSER